MDTKNTKKTQRTLIEEFMEEENKLATQIIGCAIEVHKNLGPGLRNHLMRNVFSMS